MSPIVNIYWILLKLEFNFDWKIVAVIGCASATNIEHWACTKTCPIFSRKSFQLFPFNWNHINCSTILYCIRMTIKSRVITSTICHCSKCYRCHTIPLQPPLFAIFLYSHIETINGHVIAKSTMVASAVAPAISIRFFSISSFNFWCDFLFASNELFFTEIKHWIQAKRQQTTTKVCTK